jgi:hypothetical protein
MTASGQCCGSFAFFLQKEQLRMRKISDAAGFEGRFSFKPARGLPHAAAVI